MLTFRPVKPDLENDCAWIARWNNDLETRPFVRPLKGPECEVTLETPGEVKAKLLTASGPFRPKVYWILFWDDVPVGTAEILVDPPHRLTPSHGCAWFGIHIGEISARRRGIGTQVLRELEKQAIAEGLSCAEVGVFEFNAPSIKFFASAGYCEFARVEGFTWWSGRKWADVRYRKTLCEE